MATKVTFKPNLTSPIQFEIMGEREIDLFAKIARLQEVFGERECGMYLTGSVLNIGAFTKTDKGEFILYELVCQNDKCNGHLTFGQHREGGTLFAKRDNKLTNGWVPAFTKKPDTQKQPMQVQSAPPSDNWQPDDLSANNIPF